MILVAATAAGVAVAKGWASSYAGFLNAREFELRFPWESWRIGAAIRPMTRWMVVWWPVVASWTAALVVLRVRRPRPARWRLFATPGVAACVVATTLFLLEITAACLSYAFSLLIPTMIGATTIWPGFDPMLLLYSTLRGGTSMAIGFGVASLWIWMALARRWRPEPHWIDRTGRLLALLWLILLPFRLYFDWVG